jgi:hypothetical protein
MGPLAMVNSDDSVDLGIGRHPRSLGNNTCTSSSHEGVNLDKFGDMITLKGKHSLRIGFQNIGGLSNTKKSIKDDILRLGVGKFDFDIFGLSELNVNWSVIPEEDRLYSRAKFWWESPNITTAHNYNSLSREKQQFGGSALINIGKASHRICGKGMDKTKLGRWVWVRYRGKSNHT